MTFTRLDDWPVKSIERMAVAGLITPRIRRKKGNPRGAPPNSVKVEIHAKTHLPILMASEHRMGSNARTGRLFNAHLRKTR